MKNTLLTLIISLAPSYQIHQSQSFKVESYVIWNIGQGLHTTYITQNSCLHIDAGGEYLNKKGIRYFCSHVRSSAIITHHDNDHINFLKPLNLPEEVAPTNYPIDEITSQHNKLISKNDRSRIFILKKKILIPGDSTKKAEKKWAISNQQNLSSIKVLITPHHGSNTSTSKALLNTLPNLKLAITSARKKVFGHPHYKVNLRFSIKKIPHLKTEDWGNIRIEL